MSGICEVCEQVALLQFDGGQHLCRVFDGGGWMAERAMGEPIEYPRCPHCGSRHYGQKFDDCPYVKLADDETATPEQRRNAREWLRIRREERGLDT